MTITQHALDQFRARVARLPERQVRDLILDGLRRAERRSPRRNGGWCVRVRRPLPFRVILDDAGAVVTILRSGR